MDGEPGALRMFWNWKLDTVEAFLGLVSLSSTFLEADATAPPSPGSHCQPLKFLEFVSVGRCPLATGHDPGASLTPGMSPTV